MKLRARGLLVCAAGAGTLAVASCGPSTNRSANLSGCVPAPLQTGPPPPWAAAAFSNSSPGFRPPYALASSDAVAAFMFANPLRAGHPTNPSNKVLWVVRYPRNGKPLIIDARWTQDPSIDVRISRPADSSPGEIYPSQIDLPRAGCWKVTLSWGAHRASINLQVKPRSARPSAASGLRRRASPATASSGVPGPLHGIPLTGATGLKLLVSADPPYLLDVDTGKVRPVTGLGVRGPGPVLSVLSVLSVGRDAVVWVDRHPLAKLAKDDIYVVRHGATVATQIAVGSDVQAAADRRSVWVKSFSDAHHCTLRQVSLAGRQLRGPRPVPCSAALINPGAGALLTKGRSLLDPASGRVLWRGGSVWAIAGQLALTVGEPRHPLTLTDLRTGQSRALRWPSRIGGPQSGADQTAADPSAKPIALSFSDPAYKLTGTQVTDVWLLDPTAGRWQQLPDMPADVALKFTSMSWTTDGRLVMLARTPTRGPASHDVIAVWRPGEKTLAVRSVHLPARDSGSDSFIAWTRRSP